jgi:hypothetical protein
MACSLRSFLLIFARILKNGALVNEKFRTFGKKDRLRQAAQPLTLEYAYGKIETEQIKTNRCPNIPLQRGFPGRNRGGKNEKDYVVLHVLSFCAAAMRVCQPGSA